MKSALLFAILTISTVASAGPAKDAKAAAPAAAAVTADQCDMHKAEGAMMKEMMSLKAGMSMIKLDHGTTGIITADAKNAAAIEKAMSTMEGAVKATMEGKSKLCGQCEGMLGAMKSGKIVAGMGHSGMTWTRTMLSTDAELVKMMHADVDAKMAAGAPKK